jgi:hypothetical protein
MNTPRHTPSPIDLSAATLQELTNRAHAERAAFLAAALAKFGRRIKAIVHAPEAGPAPARGHAAACR